MSDILIDGISLDLAAAAEASEVRQDNDQFWSSTRRPLNSEATEVLEIALGIDRPVNLLGFEVGRFPLTLSVQYLDGQTWRDFLTEATSVGTQFPAGVVETLKHGQSPPPTQPCALSISDSVPAVVDRSGGTANPQHYGDGHWVAEEWKTTPVRTSRIRFLLQRNPRGVGPVDPRGFATDFSLALRRIKFGYRIEGESDLDVSVPDGDTFATSHDILDSEVQYSVYRQDASRAVDGDDQTAWRSDPQPVNYAVVPFYVDARAADGSTQVIDRWYVDPLTLGVHCNIYWSDEEPSGDFLGGRTSVPSQQRTEVGNPVLVQDHIDIGPDVVAGVNVHSAFTHFNLRDPWWVGLDAVALTGVDDEQDHFLFSVGTLRLMQVAGSLVATTVDDRQVSLPLPDQHIAGTVYRMVLAYLPPGTLDQQPHLFIRYSAPGYFYQSEAEGIFAMADETADISIGLPPSTWTIDSDTPTSSVGVRGLVVKTEVLDDVASEWFLDEGEMYVVDDLTFASVTRNANLNAVVRMHPVWVANTNPFGVVGGDAGRIENNIWHPIARDYTLRRGWMEHPPVKAKYFKFEFTELSPQIFETFLTINRMVRCFPLSVVEDYLASGPTQSREYAPHGTQTMLFSTFDGHTYIDALRGLQVGNLNVSPDTTSVLVASQPQQADSAADTGWVWQYQPWHAGTVTPRWNRTSRHFYEMVPVRHRSKVAYFVGLKVLQPGISNYTAPYDTPEYVEEFYSDGMMESLSGWEQDDEGFRAASASAVLVSTVMASRSPVGHVQFATVQTNPVQVLDDPDFEDQNLASYRSYGDSEPEWLESGSVRLKRFYVPITNLTVEHLTYEEMERYRYSELEGSSLGSAQIFAGPAPPLVGEIGPGSTDSLTPTVIRPHQFSQNVDVPAEADISGDYEPDLDPTVPGSGATPGSIRWYSLIFPATGSITVDTYLSALSDGSWPETSGKLWASIFFDSIFEIDDKYRKVGRSRLTITGTSGSSVLFGVYIASSLDSSFPDTATLRVRTSDVDDTTVWDPYDRPIPPYSEGGIVTSKSYIPMGAGEVTAKVKLTTDTPLEQPIIIEILASEDGEVLASSNHQVGTTGTTEISTSYTPVEFTDTEIHTYGEIEDLFDSDPPDPIEPDFTPYNIGPGSSSPGSSTVTPTPYVDTSLQEVGPGEPIHIPPLYKEMSEDQLSTNSNVVYSGTSPSRYYVYYPSDDGFIWIDTMLTTQHGVSTWSDAGGLRSAPITIQSGGTVVGGTTTAGRSSYKISVTGLALKFRVDFFGSTVGDAADVRVRVSQFNVDGLFNPWASYLVEDGHSRKVIDAHQVSINDSFDTGVPTLSATDVTNHIYYVINPTRTGIIAVDTLLSDVDTPPAYASIVAAPADADMVIGTTPPGTEGMGLTFQSTAGRPIRFNVTIKKVSGVARVETTGDVIIRISDWDDPSGWSPIVTDAAEYEVGPGSYSADEPKQIWPHAMSSSTYTYATDLWLYYMMIPVASGQFSIDTYLSAPDVTAPDTTNWQTDLEVLSGLESISMFTSGTKARVVGDAAAGDEIVFRVRAERDSDDSLSPILTDLVVRTSDVGSITLWTPLPYTPPTETTYGFLEGFTYGRLESSAYDQRKSLLVRVRQQGITDDQFMLHSMALYDDPIAWSFSVDGGQTWYRAPKVRNDPHAVFSLPVSGNLLCWRVESAREDVWVSSLRVRPWYEPDHAPKPVMHDAASSGPNDSAWDHYPRITRHPLWVLPETPVHLRPDLPDRAAEPFWRNLVVNPGGEGEYVVLLAAEDGTVTPQIEANEVDEA